MNDIEDLPDIELQRIVETANRDPSLANLLSVSRAVGPIIVNRTGLDQFPPYPPGAATLGGLFYYLDNLSSCARHEPEAVNLYSSAIELMIGLTLCIRFEWDSKFTISFPRELGTAKKLREIHKPCGKWLQSVLHLCEKVVTIKGSRASLNTVQWFKFIVEELAASGGLCELLQKNYPLAEPSSLELKTGYDTENFFRDLHSIISRIKSLEKPDLVTGSLGLLISEAILIADSTDQFRKGVFKEFTIAMRAYLKQMNSTNYEKIILKKDQQGDWNWHISSGKGRGSPKLNTKILVHRGFQRQ